MIYTMTICHQTCLLYIDISRSIQQFFLDTDADDTGQKQVM